MRLLIVLITLAQAGALALVLARVLAGATDDLPARLAVSLSPALVLLVVHRTGSLALARELFLAGTLIALTVTAALSGGAYSRALHLLAILPVIAAALGDARVCARWFALALVVALTFYALAALDLTGVPDLPPADRVVRPATLVILTLLLLLVTAGVATTRRTHRAAVYTAVHAALRANERRARARDQLTRAAAAKQLVLTQVGRGFSGPVETLDRAARTLSEHLPPHLAQHATMLQRSTRELLDQLKRFIAFSSSSSAVSTPPAASPVAPRPSPRRWPLVDPLVRGVAALDPEARARARFVATTALVTFVVALVLIPTNALTPPANVWIPTGTAALGLVMLALLRLWGLVNVVAAMLLGALIFIGAGTAALFEAPGNPTLAWLIILGLSPLLVPMNAVTATVLVAAFATGVALAPPPPPAATLAPPHSTVALIIACWCGAMALIATHRAALRENEEALAHERERQRATESLTAALLEAAAVERDRLRTLRHELRSPLNGVLGIATLLEGEPVPPRAEVGLLLLRRLGRAVLRAFDTLLHLADTSVRPLRPEATDLVGTLDAAVTKVEIDLALDTTRRVDLRVPEHTPRVVEVDARTLRVLLDQALGTLLDAGAASILVRAQVIPGRLVVALVAHRDASGAPVTPAHEALAHGLPLAAECARVAGGALRHEELATGWLVELALPCAPLDHAVDALST